MFVIVLLVQICLILGHKHDGSNGGHGIYPFFTLNPWFLLHRRILLFTVFIAVTKAPETNSEINFLSFPFQPKIPYLATNFK